MENKSRRTFLKVTGAAALGTAAGTTAVKAMAGGHGEKEKPAKQWAMILDLGKCLKEKGCTKCIEACHTVHNVPDISKRVKTKEELIRREIKWIWKQDYEGAFPEKQHEFVSAKLHHAEIPIFCNHCEKPPCVKVCPTKATFKRKSDGIVMMDMHRCIGCRYCMVGCPYGSRSFNFMTPWPRPFDKNGTPPNLDYPTRMRGVVEKCTFCSERLVEAERQGKHTYTPACVEVCPVKALTFGDVMDPKSGLEQLLRDNHSIVRKPGLGTGPQIYYIV